MSICAAKLPFSLLEAEGVPKAEEHILNAGVLSRDLLEPWPLMPRIGVCPEIRAGNSKTGF